MQTWLPKDNQRQVEQPYCWLQAPQCASVSSFLCFFVNFGWTNIKSDCKVCAPVRCQSSLARNQSGLTVTTSTGARWDIIQPIFNNEHCFCFHGQRPLGRGSGGLTWYIYGLSKPLCIPHSSVLLKGLLPQELRLGVFCCLFMHRIDL